MKRGRAERKAQRTLYVIRGQRLARWRMARTRVRELPCFAEIERIVEQGATPEQLERAAEHLAHLADSQPRLI